MKSAILYNPSIEFPYSKSKPLKVRDIKLDDIDDDEVLVEIAYAGICHSDLSVINGKVPRPYPIALGHEASGIIMKTGKDVHNFQKGDHVVCIFLASCMQCEYCQKGRPSLCTFGKKANIKGTLLSGKKKIIVDDQHVSHHAGISAFSTHAIMSSRSIVKVPKKISLDVVAISGCALITGAGAVINTAKIPPGSHIGIVGLGGVGLSMLLGSKVMGPSLIIAMDINDEKLAFAQELGANLSFNTSKHSSVRQLMHDFEGKLDFVFDASGVSEAFDIAYKLLKPGATYITSSLPDFESKLFIPYINLTTEEKIIKGSYIGSSLPYLDIPKYLELYEKGLMPIDKLISHRISLNEINKGFDLLRSGRAKRIVIDMAL
ncbi:alcohol dehydrogenase catalytic domain-containing protein [Pradoshia sp. D12]|uniref:alcohol dehydrogenase catalytic domain-containing protein n=1 Tax=Bacillaceae TaxID=186817 RepID=UPI00112C2956|nr:MULTISPECIES: alcohol dehydrogenase catalytic domain-containing protein [Bacillaceae]QFK71392.1 alcohol dehydrogenase catalytic domain-containing protein [Pradoshia sp. D12]TPF73187.1 zinc-binding dehydrogenase [Bacillus sp. D12]